jgi:polyhydroxybutyrate depolymerase
MLRGPADWDGVEPLPLVLLLHGYSASATLQDLLFDLSGQVDERRFLLLLPDGTVDDGGDRFWNATDACCDFGGTGVDDVGYLSGLIEVVAQDFAVDSDAVFVTGHSNGGFMSYRLACDRPDLFAAIAPLAGATWQDEARCPATTPVSVLHIHGTLDADVPYEGEDGVHPGARESVMRWVTRGGCAETSQPGDPLDLVANLPSPDTDVEEWTEGCAGGTGMALWTLADGGHIPILDDSWAPALLDWLFAHRR